LIDSLTHPPINKNTQNTKQTHITPASFRDRALQKLVQEINFLKAQAVEPLSTFLEYITCVNLFGLALCLSWMEWSIGYMYLYLYVMAPPHHHHQQQHKTATSS
jgi:hypothetical protein